VASGGIAAPVLLMWGLTRTSASTASLMLNLEGVLTVLIAGALFRENIGGRIAAGLAMVIAGAALLSAAPGAGGDAGPAGSAGGAAIAGACLLWALDNNLTRRISAGNPVAIAGIKGLTAGSANLAASILFGMSLPDAGTAAIAGISGFLGYGASLVLFILALREAGAARTGALFSTAPFIGAGASLLFLGEPAGPMLLPAAALMAAGVWLQSSERHIHVHSHGSMFHEHTHVHEMHHAHAHDGTEPPGERHCHPHMHESMEHSHAHLPDIHHRHGHGRGC
jgi:drug/metabolite transporter (DMT)-like permease